MRIGIFGGTFNPIHTGHAIVASHMARFTDLDQVWLMVAPLNPFKEGQQMTVTDRDRLWMTEMVTCRIDGVSTSAFEFTLPRPSYTVDTLRALREKFPEHEFSLVIGADNWAAFDRWRSPDEIVRHHRVLVYPRMGYPVEIPNELRDRVLLVEAPVVEISSTQIRDLVATGQDVSFLVPDAVRDYILKKKLYQPQPS
ncbi:MAG: nicotinate-nucleotide adenylyltransferase [Muribaculaceae bacterium]|nr:nicotinate-nucleotide adenylyltransferase [Muribaculaceae bacterium]